MSPRPSQAPNASTFEENWGVQQSPPPFVETQPLVVTQPQPTVTPTQPQQPSVATVTEPPREPPGGTTPSPELPSDPVTGGPTIQQLLRNFSGRPGCDRYKGDAEKVKLLEDFLWLRQLTPELPFELFLELYAPIADFDAENRKHPADAIKFFLPRAKKEAEKRGVHQWTAKEIVDYVALYVDMIREAESQGVPIPIGFNDFLQNQQLLSQFHAGVFKEPAAPKESGTRPRSGRSGAAAKTPPATVGQRCIYTMTSGRQLRGVMAEMWQDPTTNLVYADFRADSGEDFKGIGISTLEVCTDPPPNPPQTPDGIALPERGRSRLTIPKAEFPSVLRMLELQTPVGTVNVGDVLYAYGQQFQDGCVALVEVVNGEAGPYVDARLYHGSPDNILAEIHPRKNVEGTYAFVVENAGVYTLEVVGNR